MFEAGLHLVRRLMRTHGRWGREVGAVATEYGLILTFIAVVIIAAIIAFGIVLNGLFEQAPSSFAGP